MLSSSTIRDVISPRHFQRRMSALLEKLDSTICVMDDILVFGATPEEHNKRLAAVLERLANTGVTLNNEKCQFSKKVIRFCGYLIGKDGIQPDPERIKALTKLLICQSVGDLRRFLKMVNQLGSFSPRLATLSQPLRQLLSKDRAWLWGPQQQQAFKNIKAKLTSHTVLAPFNVNFETQISADASSFGLGAVICQKQPSGEWRFVAYQSRAMTLTEQRYSQIEKEGLAVTWTCERFNHYLIGSPFSIVTDHKPLVPLLCTKNLDKIPPRILRFRLKLVRYDLPSGTSLEKS